MISLARSFFFFSLLIKYMRMFVSIKVLSGMHFFPVKFVIFRQTYIVFFENGFQYLFSFLYRSNNSNSFVLKRFLNLFKFFFFFYFYNYLHSTYSSIVTALFNLYHT